MKNYKQDGTANFLEIGRDGSHLRSFQNGMQVLKPDLSGLTEVSVGEPTSPSHAVTKNYVDNMAAMVISADISASNPTLASGLIGIISTDGITLQNSPNGNVGELVRYNGFSYDLVTLTDGMRISTAIAINGVDLTMLESHVFVLDNSAGIVWNDNGPQAADPNHVKGYDLSFAFGDYVANQTTKIQLGLLPSNSIVDTVDLFVIAGFDNDAQDISVSSEIDSATLTALFNAPVAGVTGNVDISADGLGATYVGSFTADGIASLTALISTYNLANPSTTITLNSANGADIPSNGEVISIALANDFKEHMQPADNNIKKAETYKIEDFDSSASERQLSISLTCGAVVPTAGSARLLVKFKRP